MKDVIIVPTYNERENISIIIPLIVTHAPHAEVLVVDDNSPDGTGEAVRELGKSYPQVSLYAREQKNGLGRAYLDAFRRVLERPDIRSITIMDADMSHDPKYLPQLFAGLDAVDIVIGSRYVPGGALEGWELWRKILSRWGNAYARTIAEMPIYDCTGGFNTMRADALRKLDFAMLERFHGYAFMMALKFLLIKRGARFQEIPIVFKNRRLGDSKISQNIIREGIVAPWKLRAYRKKVRDKMAS